MNLVQHLFVTLSITAAQVGGQLTHCVSGSLSQESTPESNPPPPTDQTHYRVAVLAIRGVESAYNDFNATAEYLNVAAGAMFDPPLTFEIVPIENSPDVIDIFQSGGYDFNFANPSIASCIASEIGAQPLVTMKNKRKAGGETFELTQFGGVIIARADNDDVQTISDIRDKIIGVVSISGLGSGQMQFRELRRSGIHHFQDPKQLIFMKSQVVIVNAVLSGDVDIGFIRTDQLERSKDDRTGELVNLTEFKIIAPKEGLVSDSRPFPFPSSTQLYPEWNFASYPHVHEDVSRAVQASLLGLEEHAAWLSAWEQCFAENGCNATKPMEPCLPVCLDQLISESSVGNECPPTPTLALAAQAASEKGRYAGWRTSVSYLGIRNMQDEIGFIRYNEEAASFRCNRGFNLVDAVVCPEGHFKKSAEDVDEGCAQQGLECYGFSCLCKPCVMAFDVDFLPLHSEAAGHVLPQNFTEGGQGCNKFSICGEVEQGGILTFQARDNKLRAHAVFVAVVHSGMEEEAFMMRQVESFVYQFDFDASERSAGSLIVEVFVDKEPTSESPFRFEIVEANCALRTGGGDRVPDENGHCVCDGVSFELSGRCVALPIVLSMIMIPIILTLGLLTYGYIEYKKRQSDAIWKVSPNELIFDTPPVRLGEGSFGVVLLANYRGTTVAVKTANKHGAHRRGSNVSSTDTDFDLEQGSTPRHRKSTSFLARTVSSDYDRAFAQGVILTSSNFSPRKSHRSALSTVETAFVKEMRHLSKLRHPCITTVMGAVIERGKQPMLVLEHMQLGSLYDVIHNDSMVLEGDIVFPIVRDIASGMRFLSTASPPVVHGDLKSKNVLIDAQFRAKVSDFGLSSHLGSSGRVSGTPVWMAPELIRGEAKNTPASDMYSFGIVLYEVFSRKHPYERQNVQDTLRLVADKTAYHRPPVPASCPGDVAQLMKSCLVDEAKDRPTAADAHELLKNRRTETAERTEALLAELFPPNVAAALRDGRKLEPEMHPSVTVYFSDIVGYTAIAASLTPRKVTDLLDRLYSKFDRLCDLHHVFKVETVGDAYMAVTNLATDQPEHVGIMARFALDALEAAAGTLIDEEDPLRGQVQVRIGLHTGAVASHVVGSRNPRYSIIGDTVNIASRMESTSKSGRIHCSAASASLIMEQCPELDVVYRGKKRIKGRGTMETYWVTGSNEEASVTTDLSDELNQSFKRLVPVRTKSKLNSVKARLIDWNTKLLKKYICRIVKCREVVGQSLDGNSSIEGEEREACACTGEHTLLDEVKEVITLPRFNARAVQRMKSNETVELSSEVNEQLHDLVETLAGMYRDNPFHSFHHASHVTMSLDKLLESVISPKELEGVDVKRRDYTLHEYTYGLSSDPLTQFAVIFSALIHDVDHPGVPNATLVKEKNELASVYKNKSVAEQNSVALAWQLLTQPRFEALCSTIASTEAEMSRFRQLVINTVLATDIVDKELKDLRNNRWEVAFSEKGRLDDSPQEHVDRKATIVMEHLIQASDVAHTMQHWHIYRRWNERFFVECYESYLAGRSEKDPSVGWYEGEIGFFDFYIIPLTLKLKECGVFGASSSEYYNCALRNRAEWISRGRKVVAELTEKVRSKMASEVQSKMGSEVQSDTYSC